MVWWFVGALVLGVAVLFISQSPIASAVSALLLFAVGKREWLWEWAMALSNTPRLLVDQQRHAATYIVPRIQSVTYPGSAQPNQDYINVLIEWDNRTFMWVEVSRLRGSVSVDGSIPLIPLPPNLPDVKLAPFKQEKTSITINLSGSGLAAVDAVRRTGKGSVTVDIDLTATVRTSPSIRPAFTADFPRVSLMAFYR